jgi:CDP-diacylglycerol--glycerol-3-phosphate 3-phosphatidyltransferase
MINLATFITLVRILLGIFVIFPMTYYRKKLFFVGVIFIFAALTDYFDGYIARKTNTETYFGGLLDHFGDKILFISAALPLAFNKIIPIYPVFLLITRDSIVMMLREYSQKNNIQIKPDFIAKTKTAILLSITAISYFYQYNLDIIWYFCTLISWYSMFRYIYNLVLEII